MMTVEIVGGRAFGSMALVADWWHMSTHAAALTIAALAYLFARRHAYIRRSLTRDVNSLLREEVSRAQGHQERRDWSGQ